MVATRRRQPTVGRWEYDLCVNPPGGFRVNFLKVFEVLNCTQTLSKRLQKVASLANLVPVIRVSITKFNCIKSKKVLCIESNPIYLNEHLGKSNNSFKYEFQSWHLILSLITYGQLSLNQIEAC